MRLWRLLGGLAYGSLPSGSERISRPFDGASAPWRSREMAPSPGASMTPNRYLPLEVPEGPAAATSIHNNSGSPQGPADLRR